MKIQYNRLRYHLLFWVLFFIYRITSTTTEKSLIGYYWWGDSHTLTILFVDIVFKAMFAYGFIYFIVPRFLDTKKYFLFASITLVWLYFVCALFIAFHFYYLEHIFTIGMWWIDGNIVGIQKRLTSIGFLLNNFSKFLFPAIILGAIKFYREQLALTKVKEEKNKMELQALKNQLNPHFLFNTLNNLYAFVVTNSPKAPDMVLRLSGMLDYALYKSQNKSVPLQEEVEAIEHFIALEQIRYGDRLQVDYSCKGDMSVPISPLLLLSFVENAFKHGASGDIDHPKIKIDIWEKKESIHCKVWNTKSQQEGELNDAYKEGIGLSNTTRQLKLIYPNNHQLHIDDQAEHFTISLTINALI